MRTTLRILSASKWTLQRREAPRRELTTRGEIPSSRRETIVASQETIVASQEKSEQPRNVQNHSWRNLRLDLDKKKPYPVAGNTFFNTILNTILRWITPGTDNPNEETPKPRNVKFVSLEESNKIADQKFREIVERNTTQSQEKIEKTAEETFKKNNSREVHIVTDNPSEGAPKLRNKKFVSLEESNKIADQKFQEMVERNTRHHLTKENLEKALQQSNPREIQK